MGKGREGREEGKERGKKEGSPPPKPKRRELEVFPDFTLAIEPPLRLEIIRVRINARIARDSPAKKKGNQRSNPG